ncbi:hypothetical protein [Niallia sp.]|uniref:hypothetical protein n=1 Tax=Niallia sp. TaxID=2837523 RepID=UPI00289F3F0E|nr:hypothetical protein [Niallia sp.]
MTDWKEVVSKFERQLDNPDLTNGEREAIEHRIKWITLLNKEKPPVSKTTFYDAVQHRLAHGYSISPASLLQD